ncbi:MAG: hypothetical protein ACLPKT_08145, partial [Methylocella sp.]
NNRPNGTDHPETDGTSFTFLGFSHVWGRSRAGKNVVRQVTAKLLFIHCLRAREGRAGLSAVDSATRWGRHLAAVADSIFAKFGSGPAAKEGNRDIFNKNREGDKARTAITERN